MILLIEQLQLFFTISSASFLHQQNISERQDLSAVELLGNVEAQLGGVMDGSMVLKAAELRPDEYSDVFKSGFSLPAGQMIPGSTRTKLELRIPKSSQPGSLGLFERLRALPECYHNPAGRHQSSHCDESSRGGSGHWKRWLQDPASESFGIRTD